MLWVLTAATQPTPTLVLVPLASREGPSEPSDHPRSPSEPCDHPSNPLCQYGRSPSYSGHSNPCNNGRIPSKPCDHPSNSIDEPCTSQATLALPETCATMEVVTVPATPSMSPATIATTFQKISCSLWGWKNKIKRLINIWLIDELYAIISILLIDKLHAIMTIFDWRMNWMRTGSYNGSDNPKPIYGLRSTPCHDPHLLWPGQVLGIWLSLT
jgi:hypothetical protein